MSRDLLIERQNQPTILNKEIIDMKYMLLMYANEADTPVYGSEEFQAAAQAWGALGKEIAAAGVLVSNHGLAPVSDATTVRVRSGQRLITDGPFAETHEQMAGYYLLECKDLDEAIGWAAKIPIAKYGSIEVRPLNQWSQK
jgi:hypothetical protein